jgi:hypothetical protein
MPCNKDLNCLLPRCQILEELWPVIISKAILKLFSNKFKLQKDPNCIIGDVQIIHAITGFYSNVGDINDKNIDIEKYINKIELKSLEDINKNTNNYNNSNNNKINDIPNKTNPDFLNVSENFQKNFLLFFNNEPNEFNENIISTKNLTEFKNSNYNFSNNYNNNNNPDNLNSISNTNTNANNNTNINNNNNNTSNISNNLSQDYYSGNFFNIKRKGLITSKFLPLGGVAPLEPIKLAHLANEKTKEILLRRSSIERLVNEKINTIKRLNDFQRHMFDDNFSSFLSPIRKFNNFGINYSHTFKDITKKKISKNDFSKISLNNNSNNNNNNNNSNSNNNNLNSEDINKTLKRASLFPQQSINDLNRIFSGEYLSILMENLAKDYEEINQIIKRSRKMVLSNKRVWPNISSPNSNKKIGIGEILRENSSKKKDKEKNFKNHKSQNNAVFGICYPVVEAFNTKGFNKIRLNTIDVNEIKDILTDIKFSYRKAPKEEKKDFLEKMIELEILYKEKQNKKIKEMQEKGKSYYLFKIGNICHDSPQLKIQCDLNEVEIETILMCFVNSLEFPKFEFYKNLSDISKNNYTKDIRRPSYVLKKEEKDEDNLNDKGLSPIKEKDFMENNFIFQGKNLNFNVRKNMENNIINNNESNFNPISILNSNPIGINNIDNKTNLNFPINIKENMIIDKNILDKKKSPNEENFNNNIKENKKDKENEDNKFLNININKKTSDKNLLIERNKSTANDLMLKTKSTFSKVKNTKTFFSVFDEVYKMTTDEYLFDIYKEMINCDIERYNNIRKIKRKNVKGNWINFEEIKKNFKNFVYLFKNEKLKIRSNINTSSSYIKDKFNKTDELLKVYIVSLIDIPEKIIIQNEIIPHVEDKKTKGKKPQKIEIIEKEVIVEKKIEKMPKSYNQPILIEFCSNYGKVGDIELEDLTNFIVFDIYEINTNLKEISLNNNIDKDNHNNKDNEHNYNNDNDNDKIKFKRRNNQKNQNQIKNDSIFTKENIKLICEDVQLKGSYSIFHKEIFESEKNYLIFIKSAFAPFGYNLKILTQIGNVESMSYDKYLMTYAGMKSIKNLNLTLPNYEANTKYLTTKFLLKFSNPANCKNMEAYIENLKKNFLEIKVNLTSSDQFLPQFFTMLLSKINKENSITNTSSISHSSFNASSFLNKIEDKIFPLNEIIYLNLNQYDLSDQFIVYNFKIFYNFLTFFL